MEQKQNIKFNKNFGQNFIFDTNLLKAIVNDAGINEYTEVLEIGTGAGTLTKEIAMSSKKVVSFAIDTNLMPVISENLSMVNNAQVIFRDIMKESMENIESNFEGSTIETSEYGSEELIEQMSSFGIKRHKLIKWGDNIQISFICNAINECLDTILEKFGGKDEINND